MPENGLPPGLAVWASDEQESEALKLARRLGVPLLVQEDPLSVEQARWVLFYEDDGLFLYHAETPQLNPITIDFLDREFTRRWKSASRNDILAKTLRLKKGCRTILDATCGFGYDAFFLATFPDVELYACERNPVAAELLMNALIRVKDEGRFEEFPFHFYFGDTAEFLTHTSTPAFDAIFLDPMYPREENKSAKQKKEMQIYRELVGKDLDAESLFELAWAKARKRVVVKRPDDAETIVKSREPDFSLEGKTVRYDIYLKA